MLILTTIFVTVNVPSVTLTVKLSDVPAPPEVV